MDAHFWQRLHGGSTHFPIVLLLVSVGMDAAALRSREEHFRRGLHAAGLASAIVGVLGGCGAVVTGLFLSNGRLLGSGFEKNHHLFVWPAFGLCVALVAARLRQRGRISRRGFGIYLGGMSVASALMMGAGYWGGEMLLGAESKDPVVMVSQQAASAPLAGRGHDLFLMNCAHCHGDDARGTEEGPDLMGLKKSDARIASLITNGIKGEMPRFGSKLGEEDIHELIRYLHSLKTG